MSTPLSQMMSPTTKSDTTDTNEESERFLSFSKIQDELKLTDEKYIKIIEQIREKNDELSKMKEQALVLSGARSILIKMCKEE